MRLILDHIGHHNRRQAAPENRIIISLELEKCNDYTISVLDSEVDYLFVSKDLAWYLGYKDKEEAVTQLAEKCHPRLATSE